MSELDWLVVRDFSLIESATWWRDGPEIESGELSTEDVATEVFFFPAAAHTEKSGSFTNTNRMLQWHSEAVTPEGDARSDLWFMYHLGRIIREKLAGSTDEMDRPVLDLTWDYPTKGPLDEPDADAVLAEINGWRIESTGSRTPLSSYEDLKDDGGTVCGCWIYVGARADGVNQAARRRPHTEMNWTAAEWGWACRPTGARSTAAPFPHIGAVATGAAALTGPAVASYTAVLAADTAVPAWHDARRGLPFVFAPRPHSACARRLSGRWRAVAPAGRRPGSCAQDKTCPFRRTSRFRGIADP